MDKWQPMLVILIDGKRLECACGAMASIMAIRRPDPESSTKLETTFWCQDCYQREAKETE